MSHYITGELPPDVAPAVDYYQQALALTEALGMRQLQEHCHRGLGTLYAQIGQREQAQAELAAAMARERAMPMTYWVSETEAMLAQVDAR